jgi:glycine/D-amino acid oxidase-like deaminating enzyme
MNSADTRRAPDFKYEPYWWDADAIPVQGTAPESPMPRNVDVLIIGGGVTGVEAARVLAAGGREVAVLDAGEPGRGASSRNAGQIGRNFKHSFSDLQATRGLDVAKQYFRELRAAYDAVAEIGGMAGDAIGWRKCGRIVAGMTPALFDKVTREYMLRAQHVGEEIEIIGPSAVSGEIGSPLYCGAIRILENGVIQPALYYRYLRNRAEAAGATFVSHTAVTHLMRNGRQFTAFTTRGELVARDILVATNGYTGAALPWFRRRLAPIDAFMIATEPLPPNIVKQILPQTRTYHDNRRRSHYMSFSPDGTRLLFGGRTGGLPNSLPAIVDALQDDLRYLFPVLEHTRISHGWTGRCAGTRDLYPHVGVHDGIHFAIGYCFSGMAMGPYLARKAAARILGQTDAAQTIFESSSFRALPLVARGPWLVPVLAGYWGWADRPRGLTRRI